jgi:hypothetical protein
MNYHARARINHQKHKMNSRPGLLNNFVFYPGSVNNCLINPLYLVNLTCNNVLMDLSNLVTLPVSGHKVKGSEPLVAMTPFLYFFLSPMHVNRVNLDNYYRYDV